MCSLPVLPGREYISCVVCPLICFYEGLEMEYSKTETV